MIWNTTLFSINCNLYQYDINGRDRHEQKLVRHELSKQENTNIATIQES